MKIDPATGRAVFPELGFTLEPTLTRARFLRLPVAAASTPGNRHGQWSRYQLPVMPQRDTELYAVLHFDGERLASLDLLHSAERFGKSLAEWTQAREQARKAFHEQWLATEQRLPCGQYRWGEVGSYYDPKGGASLIAITYRRPNAWQQAGRKAGRLWSAAVSGG